jgi:hypothetical protein
MGAVSLRQLFRQSVFWSGVRPKLLGSGLVPSTFLQVSRQLKPRPGGMIEGILEKGSKVACNVVSDNAN